MATARENQNILRNADRVGSKAASRYIELCEDFTASPLYKYLCDAEDPKIAIQTAFGAGVATVYTSEHLVTEMPE
jgi:hypothetical protein